MQPVKVTSGTYNQAADAKPASKMPEVKDRKKDLRKLIAIIPHMPRNLWTIAVISAGKRTMENRLLTDIADARIERTALL